jgi:virulence factor Mce-like protein
MATGVVRRRVQGVAFLAIVAALLALTVVVYNKALPWQSTVDVTLHTKKIGHQMIVPADVKLRGIIVGQVRAVGTEGDNATMRLALEPDKVALIPNDVKARILPKTLFGEKFVDLIIPPGSPTSTPHIKDGDVISQDRSKSAIELESVFNDLLPLLQALKPAQLSIALTNLAEAVRDQGDALGANLVHVDDYFAQLNPELPRIVSDLSALADVADQYDAAAPDLLRAIDRFTTNAKTLTEKQDAFAGFLLGTKGFAETATRVHNRNGDDMIRLALVSRPTLATLARYSPEFTCLLVGIDKIQPLLNKTFAPVNGFKPALHITLEVLPTQPKGYTYPADKPRYDTDTGPDCHGLPGSPDSSVYPDPSTVGAIGMAGSAFDVQAVSAVTAPVLGIAGSDVPNWMSLLTGPLVRGMQVELS